MKEFQLNPGMGQEIKPEQISFDLNYLVAFELTKMVNDYTPLIISLNYNDSGKQYAMISYAVFIKNAEGTITGARIEKQIVLVRYQFISLTSARLTGCLSKLSRSTGSITTPRPRMARSARPTTRIKTKSAWFAYARRKTHL